MKLASQHDLEWILQTHRNRSKSSFVALSTIHGYSASELEQILSGPNHSMFQQAGEGTLLLSVHDLDAEGGQARIQLCACEHSKVPSLFLHMLMKQHNLKKLSSFVFPEETHEQSILKAIGFSQEAVFREHVYMAGSFRDLLVFSLLEKME